MTSNPSLPKASETSAESAAAGAAADPVPNESFGRYLLRERELRGMSLEQIADQTRIGTTNLRALEQDDARRLPARVFVLGYIRAYANVIGLNPDDAVLRYDEYLQSLQPPADDEAARRPRRRRRVVALLVAICLACGGAAWYFLQR
jgi:cytoskeletal protein RodZ